MVQPPRAQVPTAAVVKQWCARQGFFLPEPPSKHYLLCLWVESKKAIRAINSRPVMPEIANSPYINGQALYQLLHQDRRWVNWLPDAQTKGVTKFTQDLVNTWSGSELQSFLVAVQTSVK